MNIENGLSEISTLTKLEALIANNCNISSLSSGGTPVLAGMHNLKLLDLSNNALTSLDTVLDANTVYGRLKEIYLNDNELNSISQLANAPFMQLLTLSNNDLDSSDISALSSMSYLTYLSLADNSITDISSLSGLKNLTELRLQNNKISDVTALKDMTAMVSLYLGDNQITNVSKLEKLTKITTLYLNNNAELENVDIVSGMTGLKVLNVSGDNIDNLNAVSALAELIELFAENNSISSFAFVQNLTNLNKLLLANNRDTGDEAENMSEFLEGLSKLTVLTLSGKKLNTLDFLQTTDSNNNTTMKSIVRLEIANCSLPSYYATGITENTVTEYVDNINLLAALKQTLLYLDISGNAFANNTGDLTFSSGEPVTIEKLKDLSNLQLLYADNTDIGNKITTLMSMMSRIKYLSLENCNIFDVSWLTKSAYYIYVDIANNPISAFDFSYVRRSLGTMRYLYLDSTVSNAKYACDDPSDYDENILVALSFKNIVINNMSKLPALPEIQYLDVSQSYVDIFNRSNLELLYETFGDITVNLYAEGQLPDGFDASESFNAAREAQRIVDIREADNADGDKFQSHSLNVVDFKNEQNGHPLDSAFGGYDISWSVNDKYFSVKDNSLYVDNIALPIKSNEDYILDLSVIFTVYGNEVTAQTYTKFSTGSYEIKYVLDSQFKDGKSENVQDAAVDNSANPISYLPGDSVNIKTPTRSQYDEFLGWYTDATFATPFVNDLSENPRGITLYAKWKYAVYYEGVNRPSSVSKIVESYPESEVVRDVAVLDFTKSSISGAFDFSYGIKEAYLIGDGKTVYDIPSISIKYYPEESKLLLHMDNFKFSGFLIPWYDGFQDVGMYMTIDISGDCAINSGIDCFRNLTITGTGNLIVIGENGDDAVGKGNSGADGKAAINVGILTVDLNGILKAKGGDGGDGAIGKTGNKGASGNAGINSSAPGNQKGDDLNGSSGGTGDTGGTGGAGGDGASGIVAESLYIASQTIVEISSGDGGDGGDGGQGGQGGRGGDGGSDDSSDDCPAGDGGAGGKGGQGGRGGKGGDVNTPISKNCIVNSASDNVTLIVGSPGAGGAAGLGGGGGIGGAGGNPGNHGDWGDPGGSLGKGDSGSPGNAGTTLAN